MKVLKNISRIKLFKKKWDRIHWQEYFKNKENRLLKEGIFS